jgi:hypothetical protein
VELEDSYRSDPSAGSYHSQRKAKIRADIAQRLRRVCSALPETDFQELVEEMAERQLRGERRTIDDW